MSYWGCYRCKRSLPMNRKMRHTKGGYFICVAVKGCTKALERHRAEKKNKTRSRRPWLVLPDPPTPTAR